MLCKPKQFSCAVLACCRPFCELRYSRRRSPNTSETSISKHAVCCSWPAPMAIAVSDQILQTILAPLCVVQEEHALKEHLPVPKTRREHMIELLLRATKRQSKSKIYNFFFNHSYHPFMPTTHSTGCSTTTSTLRRLVILRQATT